MAYRTGCGAAAEMAPASSSSSSSSSSSASSVLLSQTLSGDVSGFFSEKRRCEGKNRVPSGLLLLSAAIPRPLKNFGHNSNLKLSDTVAAVPPLLGHLLSSLASAADSFKGFGHNSNLKLVDTVAAVPPLLGHWHSSFASVAVDSLKGSRHNYNLKLADTVAVVSPLVGHLHFSFASAADSFKGFLHSLSFRLQTFFHQVTCRNLQSTNSLSNHSDIKKMNSLSNHSFAAILPGDSLAGVVVTNGILNFLNIYNTLLVVRLVLTWFPNTPPVIVSPLSMLCDPYLNIFRGLIPPLGGTLDISPILAFLVLNAFTNTASALPAELPSSAVSQASFRSTRLSGVTSSQRKWMRRLCGNR